MTCELLYDGKPELDLILKGTKGSFVSEHMPSIKVDLHWLQLQVFFYSLTNMFTIPFYR